MQVLLRSLFSKARHDPEVNVADYVYLGPKKVLKTNQTGDTFVELTYAVVCKGKPLGFMTIWHNRDGAFAHFSETRKYPLG